MPEAKTKLTGASVSDFLDAIGDGQTRKDCQTIAKMMQRATKAAPRMWGSSIVGFGQYTQIYASGREAEWMMIGFSPRKQNIALYLMMGDLKRQEPLLAKLGSHDCGKGCLYIKRLADVHVPTLEKLVRTSVQQQSKANSRAKKR